MNLVSFLRNSWFPSLQCDLDYFIHVCSHEHECQAFDLFCCCSWDLGQLCLSHLPPTLVLPTPPRVMSEAPPHSSRHIFIGGSPKLFFLACLWKQLGKNNHGCSLGYPRFLLLLPPPEASPPFALICPEWSALTGSSSLSTSAIVAEAINILAPKWGFEVKAWHHSTLYSGYSTLQTIWFCPGNQETT